MAEFAFGTGGTCCGKPRGCNLPYRGCKYIALRKGNPAAHAAWEKAALEQSLALPDFWGEARPRNVALARERGEEVGVCPLHGEFPVGSALDCMTQEGVDHRRLREYALTRGGEVTDG